MTKDTMAKLPGLFQRGSVYQLRVVVPSDLQEAYGKSKIVQSLETTNLREARLEGTRERSRLLEEFDTKRRQLQPQKLGAVTPEMARQLADRVRAAVLRADDILRDHPAARKALFNALRETVPDPLEALTIRSRKSTPAAPWHELDGLSPEDAQVLTSLNEVMSNAAGVTLAQRRLSAVLPLVALEAKSLGFTLTPL